VLAGSKCEQVVLRHCPPLDAPRVIGCADRCLAGTSIHLTLRVSSLARAAKEQDRQFEQMDLNVSKHVRNHDHSGARPPFERSRGAWRTPCSPPTRRHSGPRASSRSWPEPSVVGSKAVRPEPSAGSFVRTRPSLARLSPRDRAMVANGSILVASSSAIWRPAAG
jgi:hypothetical protein